MIKLGELTKYKIEIEKYIRDIKIIINKTIPNYCYKRSLANE